MHDYAVCCDDLTTVEGWPSFDRGCWTLELADAVTGAREDRYAFYVVVDGRRVDLTVDARADGEPYLRPADLDPETAVADALPLPRLGAPAAAPRTYARPVSPR